MADVVKIKAGSKAKMPKLPDRELGWARDERELYIGTPNGNVSVTANVRASLSQLVSRMYPVGSLYSSTSSTDPSQLFGGTWEVYTGDSSIITDDTTGDRYRLGADNGALYVEEVAGDAAVYTWRRIS
jgi:hypothetical protein